MNTNERERKTTNRAIAVVSLSALTAAMGLGQAPPGAVPAPTARAVVEEVVLDLIVRDKKGKPVNDLTPAQVTVTDNGAARPINSFRLVRGREAVNHQGGAVQLDPLRQVRLVALTFDALASPDQRKTAREAALDLVRGDHGANVFYAVMFVNTRLYALQPFTADKEALAKAIERATSGQGINTLASESDAIQAELKRTLGRQTVNGAEQDANLLSAATQAAASTTTGGAPKEGADQFVQAKLASVMLDILRFDTAAAGQGTRMTIDALEALVRGLQAIPGRKSVLYFSAGLYLPPELDVPFRRVIGDANRANVTFYALDTRGVLTTSQNRSAMTQLNGAARASNITTSRTSGGVTKEEIMSGDNAEVSARANVQLAIQDLAESTGGFLISDSNDLRGPVRRIEEEIASYYELTYDPGIKNYDGSFRKIAVSSPRKELVFHARSGYFALPPEARETGVETFEIPLLKAISEGKASTDVEYRAGAILLNRSPEGRSATVLVEVPLRVLQAKPDAGGKNLRVRFGLAAVIKNGTGEVVQKLSRERSLQVTPEQAKGGNFSEKLAASLAPGDYTLESAVMDLESGKIGMQRTPLSVPQGAKGVAISSLTAVKAYQPNAKGLDPAEPFQYHGGAISPTLDTRVQKTPDASVRLFFTVYQDGAVPAKPTVQIQFEQQGKVLQKLPLPLTEADSTGRIPTVMTIPAAAIPPGSYLIRAIAQQGESAAQALTTVTIEGK